MSWKNKKALDSQLSQQSIEWLPDYSSSPKCFDIEAFIEFIDIVSGVVIDRRSLNKTNAKKVLRLCKQKMWSIKVRCRSPFDNTHFFMDYDEYIKTFGEK